MCKFIIKKCIVHLSSSGGTEPSSTTILCVMQEMKAPGRLGTHGGSSDLSLLADAISTKISAGSYDS